MVLFAVAHALRLEDGSYAVRSPEFPGCEARNSQVELAREQFAEALCERALQMIQAGAAPPLYSYEELVPSFATRCTMQIPAPDRLPGSFDRVMAVRVKLPPEAAAGLERRHAAPQSTQSEDPEPSAGKNECTAPDTSAPERETRARLGPSARLALVAARLADRDRDGG
jgi:hypothetical protein